MKEVKGYLRHWHPSANEYAAGIFTRGTMKVVVSSLLLIWVIVPAWAQEKGWEKEWNKVLAAAKKEGSVVVRASSDPAIRRVLPAKFHARFGIQVEYIAGRGSQVAGRLRVERRAKVYTVDAIMNNVGSMANVIYQEKMLDPLKPALILPEVVDPSKWKKGKLWFMDPEEKYVLRLFNHVQDSALNINTRYVKAEELKSMKDLLNPKWKGRIAVFDPTGRGRGVSAAARLYLQFGEEFIKKLYVDQNPVFSRNTRQLTDWLAHGTYPITFGASAERVRVLQEEGFPVMTISGLHDLLDTVASGPLVGLVNQAPHPNAAQVFVNWIASKEGVEFFARAKQYGPARNDINESFLRPEVIPRPGMNYFDTSNWEFVTTQREKIVRRIKKILKR